MFKSLNVYNLFKKLYLLLHPKLGILTRKELFIKVRSYLRYLGILPPLRILYLSCHSILEYDEVTLLREMGFHVFSPGDFVDQDNPGKPWLRPLSNRHTRAEIADQKAFNSFGHHGQENKTNLIRSFVDRFDIVLVMHIPQWITLNWAVMKHKTVIWRTIGQSSAHIEEILHPFRLQGLKIVRYSPLEKNIPNYIGCDAVIRFYKDPSEYCRWHGNTNAIMSISQNIRHRADACHFEIYQQIASLFETKLFGPGNINSVISSVGEVSPNDLKKALQQYRCFFYTGTFPASYTLSFIEAWMTGIPVVAIGNKLMHDRFHDDGLYEIPHLIINGQNGFYADSVEDFQRIIKMLLDDPVLALKISKAGRLSAIKYFGKETIKLQWLRFLEDF